MALTSPALTLAVDTLFGYIRPSVAEFRKMGFTDFSKEAPNLQLKPGATTKYALSSVEAASEFNASTNNYLTGGTTSFGSLTCKHYLQGFDVTGVNIDEGINASAMKQKFAMRAGAGIAYAFKNALITALDGVTASTAVKLPALGASSTIAISDYDGLGDSLKWLDKENSVLVLNGAEWSKVKALMHASYLSATKENVAAELGFKDVIVLGSMTARACIVPFSSIGFLAKVPTVAVRYAEAGVETDDESGLSLGIVVAEDQATNKQVVNADLWMGIATVSSPAAATSSGIIKVTTST